MSLVREMPVISILSICSAILLLTQRSFRQGRRDRFVSLGQWGEGWAVANVALVKQTSSQRLLPIDAAVM